MIIPVSPLSLNQLTREYWGMFDAGVLAQLAPLADNRCYQMKFYKAPAGDQEVLAAFAYVTYGLQITPGSIIFGFYLPMVLGGIITDPVGALSPGDWTVQITDVSLQHKWFDDPVSAMFLANFKPEFCSNSAAGAGKGNCGTFPNLLVTPYPVVGSGLFDVEIQSTSTNTDVSQRVELVLGVLEVCSE